MVCDAKTLQNLADAGCGDTWVERYRMLSEAALPAVEMSRRQENLLRLYRREILDSLHEQQRRLDCLDYLLYQLRLDIEGKTIGGKP